MFVVERRCDRLGRNASSEKPIDWAISASVASARRSVCASSSTKMHRSPQYRLAQRLAGSDFGTLLQLSHEGGENLAKTDALILDFGVGIHQRRAEHAFQRAAAADRCRRRIR